MRSILSLALVAAFCLTASAQQSGDLNRDLVINGNGSLQSSVVSTSVFGDFALSYTTQDAGAPILLVSASGSTTNWAPGLAANSVDIGPAGLNFLLNGLDGSPFSIFLATDSSGRFGLTVSVPAALFNSNIFLAMAHVSPTSPDGFFVSQTHNVTFQAAFCNPAATNLNLSDDSSSLQNLAVPFTFYGSSYSSIEIWSNGSIEFGAGSGTGGFNFDQTSFVGSGAPEMALFATDLNPSQGGSVNFFTNATGFTQVCFDGVPEFFSTGSNTFRVEFDNSGLVTMSYLNVDAQFMIVGLSAGNNLFPGAPIDLTLPGGNAFATQVSPFEEFFGPSDLSNTTISWLLDGTGFPILQF